MFFFEKKNQKTFVTGASRLRRAWPKEIKVFCFFFSKKKDFLAADDGFTLLEMIVAVVVLGFVLAGLVQGTRFGINAWDVQARLTDNASEMERVDRVLRELVEQASPPMAADDKPFLGQEHRMVIVSRLADQPPTQPVRRAQVAVGVDDQHRLLLRWQPHPNAVAILPVPPPAQIVLCEGVDHIDFSYRQAVGDGGRWKTSWDDSSLPALVTMHVVLTSAHRQIPLIEAATMIDTNGSF
jgi:general secretion pathway protein J